MTDHDIIHKVQDFFDNPNMRVNSTDLLNGDNVNTAVAAVSYTHLTLPTICSV